MSSTFNLNTDFAKEKLYGLSVKQKQKSEEQEQRQQNLVKQDPSMSGISWAAASEKVSSTQKPDDKPKIVLPDLNDVAMLSSAVSTQVNTVAAPSFSNRLISRLGINKPVLKEKFKDRYKGCKSHNLLQERFMNNAKLCVLVPLMTLAGFSSSEIENFKTEVRQEALAEIDSKLSQDWANAKAMIEIMG